MNITLSKEEANNVKVALLSLAKSPQVNEEGMKVLLILSDKFNVVKVETPKEEVK